MGYLSSEIRITNTELFRTPSYLREALIVSRSRSAVCLRQRPHQFGTPFPLAAPSRAPLTYYRLVEHINYVTDGRGDARGGYEAPLVGPVTRVSQGRQMAVASIACDGPLTCL